jgi:hypothetical protein
MTFPRETGVYPANSRLTSAFPRLVASPHKSRARFDATRTTSSADNSGRVSVPLLRRGPVIV